MSFQSAVQSTVTLSTTSSQSANLGGTIFISPNFSTKYRTKNYSSFTEVKEDSAVSINSESYKAMLTFFKQSNAAVPVLLGKRQADDVTFTATTLVDNKEYSFDLEVYDTTTLAGTTYTVSVTSGISATAADIATLLYTEIEVTQPIPNLIAVDNTGSVTLTPDSGYSFVITNTTSNLTESFSTTEPAAEVLAAVIEEANEDFYFITSSDHSETFVLAMADEVEALGSSDYPKMYAFSTSDSNSIVPLTNPAIDLLGKVEEKGYSLTFGIWHHEDTIYPEMAPLSMRGSVVPGTSAWKFLQFNGVTGAKDSITGKDLFTAKQGYILDRNASVYSSERGVTFLHGCKLANGEWIDVVRASHYINDLIETRLLNLLLNKTSANSKVSFATSDTQLVLDTIDGVLQEASDRNILTGYIKSSITVDPSFADQATRKLNDIKWTGYLAGAIHFILVDGDLTYTDAEIE